ncbi:unnamed protein product, partial [Symbiodinium necroappetens]
QSFYGRGVPASAAKDAEEVAAQLRAVIDTAAATIARATEELRVLEGRGTRDLRQEAAAERK